MVFWKILDIIMNTFLSVMGPRIFVNTSTLYNYPGSGPPLKGYVRMIDPNMKNRRPNIRNTGSEHENHKT